MQSIRCITFDLDDTLWAIKPVIHRAEKRFYQWLLEHYPRISDLYSSTELVNHRIGFMRQQTENLHNLTHLRKLWMAELAMIGDYGEEIIEPGFRVFWEARNEVELFDHVESTLELLGRRYTIGAISNGNADVDFIGIQHLFDFAVNSEQAGTAKPNKEIFQLAASSAKIPLEQVLHVGDDKESDVLGALNAGAKAAWVTDSPEHWEHCQQPDLVVSHVSELIEQLIHDEDSAD